MNIEMKYLLMGKDLPTGKKLTTAGTLSKQPSKALSTEKVYVEKSAKGGGGKGFGQKTKK